MNKLKLTLFLILLISVFPSEIAKAGPTSTPTSTPTSSASAGPTIPPKEVGVVKLENPLIISTDIKVIIGRLIKTALQILGSLALLMVFFGASGWITSGGNPEKIEAGQKTIIWAVLGVILTLSSYIILSGIFKLF